MSQIQCPVLGQISCVSYEFQIYLDIINWYMNLASDNISYHLEMILCLILCNFLILLYLKLILLLVLISYAWVFLVIVLFLFLFF